MPKSIAFLIIVIGLSGAAGVGLASMGAHVNPDPRIVSAANLLIPHGGAALALAALAVVLTRNGAPGAKLFALAGWIMILGADLFAADMTARVFSDFRIFPMAAPTGGMLVIAGWMIAGIAGFWIVAKGQKISLS